MAMRQVTERNETCLQEQITIVYLFISLGKMYHACIEVHDSVLKQRDGQSGTNSHQRTIKAGRNQVPDGGHLFIKERKFAALPQEARALVSYSTHLCSVTGSKLACSLHLTCVRSQALLFHKYTTVHDFRLGLCIVKGLAIRYISRFMGHDTIYCNMLRYHTYRNTFSYEKCKNLQG